MATQGQKIRLGDLLVENGLITEDQLKQALKEQQRTGKKLGKVVVDLDFVDEEKLIRTLADFFSLPFIDITHFKIRPETVRTLPESQARRFRAIVLQDTGKSYVVGMTDPMDLVAIDALQRTLKKTVMPAFVKENDLLETIDATYRRSEQIASIAGELETELGDTPDFDLDAIASTTDTTDAPVVRLLQNIMEDAVQVKASDIHIEPDENVLRVRLRIDGELQEQIMKEHRVGSALVSRLKIMSGLDISEKRLPQDGRFQIRVLNKNIDVRVSTMPVVHGEAVVMRLLDQSAGLLNIESIGMPKKVRERFRTLINRPHGMVLVTGPTGSGKTTTLYAALNEINTPERKIITAEDPVEYRLPRINQVQVNTKIDLTFARVLRTALRQDPDVILLGEMRDQETAEIGMRAALTGHFVLSTLHTNDGPSTAMRLLDMGVDSFIISSSINAVIAQRLVRKICPHCKTEHDLEDQEKMWLRNISQKASEQTYYKGKGCHRCNNTGYQGRTGVHELLEFDEPMLEALRRKDSNGFMQAAKANPHYEPLTHVTLKYAIAGITSLDEVFKIAASLEDRED